MYKIGMTKEIFKEESFDQKIGLIFKEKTSEAFLYWKISFACLAARNFIFMVSCIVNLY